MQKLHLQHVEKRYHAVLILNIEQWELGKGTYWIKGGNGAGKTTLFRVISGQAPFKGDIWLDAINLRKDPVTFRSKISYAEAEPQYPGFLTAKELLDFYASARSEPQEEINRLAAFFGLEEYLNQKINSYSSGMLKKLSLIAAFLGAPDLYILDEPLITLDKDAEEKLYQLINEKMNKGKSFLIASHQEIDRRKLLVNAVFELKDKKPVKC